MGPCSRCRLSADRGGWGTVLLLLGPARACHAGAPGRVFGDTVGRMEDGSLLFGWHQYIKCVCIAVYEWLCRYRLKIIWIGYPSVLQRCVYKYRKGICSVLFGLSGDATSLWWRTHRTSGCLTRIIVFGMPQLGNLVETTCTWTCYFGCLLSENEQCCIPVFTFTCTRCIKYARHMIIYGLHITLFYLCVQSSEFLPHTSTIGTLQHSNVAMDKARYMQVLMEHILHNIGDFGLATFGEPAFWLMKNIVPSLWYGVVWKKATPKSND